LNAKQRKTMQKKRTQAAVFYPSGETVSTDLRVPSPAGLVDFAIAPESQPVSDERADKTAADKGN
jgi:hypothetical protein